MTNQFERLVMRLLEITAKHDDCDLWWRTDGEYAPVTFFINCNDLFFWGCADCEAVTEDNIAGLEQAYKDAGDCYKYGTCYAQLLFCCRQREMRPQQPYYKELPEQMWNIFNKCGPERTDA